jgi:endonuclease/exonuclease/phosphatase (EEP) superfamily protein YafD
MLIWWILYLGLAVIIFSTIVGSFGHIWWVFDLFSHFRVQYFFASVGLALVIFIYGKEKPGVLAGIFVLVNLVQILPIYFSGKKQKAVGVSYRLMLANVNTPNQHHGKVRNLIEETSPDLMVLIEVDENWLDVLGLADLGYNFCVDEPRGDNYGIALYSRFPFISSEVINLGQLGMPSVCARLHIGDDLLTLIGSHPPPPKSRDLALYRDQQIGEIMDYARTREGEIIFCGDINMTSWSSIFKHLLERGSLTDSRRGFGIQPTWPTWMPLLLVPIDHIWISRNIQVHNRRVGPRIGSDHHPVILDFSINSHRSERIPG